MAFSSSANFLVSLAVLFIFQLPAMMVLRYLRFMAVFLSYFSLYFHAKGAEPPPRVILLLLVQQTGHAGLVAASAVSLASPPVGKARSLRCGSSPHRTRSAGLRRGPHSRSCPAGTRYLSSRQATPGSSLPSRNSREAPPPVEMWVILSA